MSELNKKFGATDELKTRELKNGETLAYLLEKYEEYKEQGLNLNMSRGKPCKEQLDLSMKMMDVLNSSADLRCEDGIDCRNYGVLGGIEECKRLLGDIIEVPAKNIIIYGNSSLNVMYDCNNDGEYNILDLIHLKKVITGFFA